MISHGTHEVFLREALALAEQAHARGDEPFGAVLVVNGEVVLTVPSHRLKRLMGACDAAKIAELNEAIKAAFDVP